MTQDEIIRMALEAGFVEYEIDDGTTDAFDVRYERFANLVANLVAAAEREACAKLCDDKHRTWRWDNEADSASGPRDCAAAIRARGNT